MRKTVFLFFAMLLSYSGLFSGEFSLEGGGLSFKGETYSKVKIQNIKNSTYSIVECSDAVYGTALGQPQIPMYSKLIYLPESGNYKINKAKYDTKEIKLDKPLIFAGIEDKVSKDAEVYNSDKWYPEEVIKIEEPVIMGGVRFVQVSIAACQYNPKKNTIRQFSNFDVSFKLDNSDNTNSIKRNVSKISENIANIAKQNILGMPKSIETYKGKILFIYPSNIQDYIAPLVQWKQQMGYKTIDETVENIGSSFNSVRNYVLEQYQDEDPITHLLIIGDCQDDIMVPADFKPGYLNPTIVTDHSYAVLEGDDYFPDIMVGRISARSFINTSAAVAKIYNYESNPPTVVPDWFTKAIMCGLNGNEYNSSKEVLMNTRRKLLEFNYTQVDTFIAPEQNSSSQLVNLINTGYSIIGYRGFGGPSGWSGSGGPLLDVNNLGDLNNGLMLPFVTGIVCGGGDFADQWERNSFGEKWLTTGTPTQVRGGIGFIGPSEHDTKTPFNNCNFEGIYQGITNEDITNCAEIMLRGKMEMYLNYPRCHEWGNALNSDQFYFYTYNLLGDPTLDIWVDTPKNMTVDHLDQLNTGETYFEVMVTPIELVDKNDFYVTITKDGASYGCSTTNSEGKAYFETDLEAGDYTITTSKKGFKPVISQLEVISSETVKLLNPTFTGNLTSGGTGTFNFELESSFSSNLSNVEVELSGSENITITTPVQNIGVLEPSNSVDLDYEFNINNGWSYGAYADFIITVTSDNEEVKHFKSLELDLPELTFVQATSAKDVILNQNQVNDIYISLKNIGVAETGSFETNLTSADSIVTITQASASFNNISANTTAPSLTAYSIEVDNVDDGTPVDFVLEILKNTEKISEVQFTLTIGEVNETTPTFSDYGYVAYESRDLGYENTPTYDWTELHPSLGTTIWGDYFTWDGYSKLLNLPFDFQYYGETYDKITISSLGYISMGDDKRIFFRNRTIPSGNGVQNMIAPFWDYLHKFAGVIYYNYDNTNHTFTVEWYDVKNHATLQGKTFQVILYDPEHYPTSNGDGLIKFQYKNIQNDDTEGNYATVGIENKTQDEGLLITFSDFYPETVHELANETAILFAPGYNHITGIDDVVISSTELIGNYPNPFNPETKIQFKLAENSDNVSLKVYNIKGDLVKTLYKGKLGKGIHSFNWNGTDNFGKSISSGLYFCNLKVSETTFITKMILTK